MKHLLLLLSLLFLPAHHVQAAHSTSTLLEATNQARIENHQKPLAPSTCLTNAAQKAAEDLARTETFTHRGWTEYIKNCPHTYSGQNLARNFTDSNDTVEAWLRSPGHRANLLRDTFTQTGLGIAQSNDGRYYVVQYFAHPLDPLPIRSKVKGNAK